MIDLRTERPFWQVKAEYADFAAFLADMTSREDHITTGGGRRNPRTFYRAGDVRICLEEDGAALLNVFRPLTETVHAYGTPIFFSTWPNDAVKLAQQRYECMLFDAVACCYLDEKYEEQAFVFGWKDGLAGGFEKACQFAWDTAELMQAQQEAWAAEPEKDLYETFAAAWPGWWEKLTGQHVTAELNR